MFNIEKFRKISFPYSNRHYNCYAISLSEISLNRILLLHEILTVECFAIIVHWYLHKGFTFHDLFFAKPSLACYVSNVCIICDFPSGCSIVISSLRTKKNFYFMICALPTQSA